MKRMTVSVAEGKKRFSGLINDAVETGREIIVTRRGKPVAVILSYDGYLSARRLEGFRKIMEGRRVFSKAGIKAGEVYKESRRELEKKH